MFQFQQFTIHQDQCAMKVGTDGVLLGAWASLPSYNIDNHLDTSICKQDYKVLDIGTGTGIISLMLAQRLTEINVDFQIEAIEIDKDASLQAQSNFDNSPWSKRLKAYPLSLQQFSNEGSLQPKNKKYNLIISNPPFYNATLKPDDEARAIARHKDSLPIEEITKYAALHLTREGRLSMIYPTAYDNEVMTAVVLSNLHPVRICDIVTKEGKTAKRRMVEFSLSASSIAKEMLAIRDNDGKYTPEYKVLTGAFYLHLTD